MLVVVGVGGGESCTWCERISPSYLSCCSAFPRPSPKVASYFTAPHTRFNSWWHITSLNVGISITLRRKPFLGDLFCKVWVNPLA